MLFSILLRLSSETFNMKRWPLTYPVMLNINISKRFGFWALFQERYPVNTRQDIGLSDQDLIVLPIKELNTLLRSNFCSRERVNELKA